MNHPDLLDGQLGSDTQYSPAVEDPSTVRPSQGLREAQRPGAGTDPNLLDGHSASDTHM